MGEKVNESQRQTEKSTGWASSCLTAHQHKIGSLVPLYVKARENALLTTTQRIKIFQICHLLTTLDSTAETMQVILRNLEADSVTVLV